MNDATYGMTFDDVLGSLNNLAKTGLDVYREVKHRGNAPAQAASGGGGDTAGGGGSAPTASSSSTVLLIGGAVLLFLLLRK